MTFPSQSRQSMMNVCISLLFPVDVIVSELVSCKSAIWKWCQESDKVLGI